MDFIAPASSACRFEEHIRLPRLPARPASCIPPVQGCCLSAGKVLHNQVLSPNLDPQVEIQHEFFKFLKIPTHMGPKLDQLSITLSCQATSLTVQNLPSSASGHKHAPAGNLRSLTHTPYSGRCQHFTQHLCKIAVQSNQVTIASAGRGAGNRQQL